MDGAGLIVGASVGSSPVVLFPSKYDGAGVGSSVWTTSSSSVVEFPSKTDGAGLMVGAGLLVGA